MGGGLYLEIKGSLSSIFLSEYSEIIREGIRGNRKNAIIKLKKDWSQQGERFAGSFASVLFYEDTVIKVIDYSAGDGHTNDTLRYIVLKGATA